MDVAFMRKTFALIAKGLVEKEQLLQQEPTRYPYSKTLQHGMNMFLSACVQAGCLDDVIPFSDEASFLSHFITKPISEWFSGWNQEILDKMHLRDEVFYAYDAFAYRRSGNVYTPSSDCYEFLDLQDSDIMEGTDERILYEKMTLLEQGAYKKIRKYIIEHPIISIEDRRKMLMELAGMPAAQDAFQFAYEEITENFYVCPACHWTMTQGKYGYNCHSMHCTDTFPDLHESDQIDVTGRNLYRLKKGVMRYFAAPGKLELQIAEYCEKKNIHPELWPEMDRYDVGIEFSDGTIWEIDAKAYRNPLGLRKKIQDDNGFPKGEYERGYFVIPDEYTRGQRQYTRIINEALQVLPDQDKVKCVTLTKLKREITRKVDSCCEKESE